MRILRRSLGGGIVLLKNSLLGKERVHKSVQEVFVLKLSLVLLQQSVHTPEHGLRILRVKKVMTSSFFLMKNFDRDLNLKIRP